MDLSYVRSRLDRMREESASYKAVKDAHSQNQLRLAENDLDLIEHLLLNGNLDTSSTSEEALFAVAESHLKAVRDSVKTFGYDTETPG